MNPDDQRCVCFVATSLCIVFPSVAPLASQLEAREMVWLFICPPQLFLQHASSQNMALRVYGTGEVAGLIWQNSRGRLHLHIGSNCGGLAHCTRHGDIAGDANIDFHYSNTCCSQRKGHREVIHSTFRSKSAAHKTCLSHITSQLPFSEI